MAEKNLMRRMLQALAAVVSLALVLAPASAAEFVAANKWLSARALSSVGTGYVERSFVDSVQAGSLIVAAVQIMGDQVPTFSDTVNGAWPGGNVYVPTFSDTLSARWAFGWIENSGAGAMTVRATLPDDTNNRSIMIAEITGMATSSALDGTPTFADGSSDSAMAPGNITSTGDAVFIGIAAWSWPAGEPTAGSGFTATHNTDGDYKWSVEDQIVTGAATINPSWSNKTFWRAMGIAFKAAAGGDSTPPTLTSATGTATSGTAATVGATTDEANGTLYAVVTTSSTQPSVSQIKAGDDHTGADAVWAGSVSVSSTGAKTLNATGLTASTTYYAHLVHTDSSANDSNRVTSSSFVTVVKYLKLLLNAAAVGATVDGIAWATEADAIAGAEYGEFTGKTIAAGTGDDSGYGVLKVPLSEIGSPALDVDDTLVVAVRSSTHFSAIWTAVVIEE